MAEAGSGAAREALLREAEGSDWASLLARLAELQAEWERLAATASRAAEPVLVEVSSRVGRALLGGADALSLLAVARESRLEGEGEPLAGRQDWARLRALTAKGWGDFRAAAKTVAKQPERGAAIETPWGLLSARQLVALRIQQVHELLERLPEFRAGAAAD